MTSVRASASRSAPTSGLRRASEIVLVAGTVIAVAAAFGPLWATRVGVAVAVAAAVVACVCAWRELFNAERRHARHRTGPGRHVLRAHRVPSPACCRATDSTMSASRSSASGAPAAAACRASAARASCRRTRPRG